MLNLKSIFFILSVSLLNSASLADTLVSTPSPAGRNFCKNYFKSTDLVNVLSSKEWDDFLLLSKKYAQVQTDHSEQGRSAKTQIQKSVDEFIARLKLRGIEDADGALSFLFIEKVRFFLNLQTTAASKQELERHLHLKRQAQENAEERKELQIIFDRYGVNQIEELFPEMMYSSQDSQTLLGDLSFLLERGLHAGLPLLQKTLDLSAQQNRKELAEYLLDKVLQLNIPLASLNNFFINSARIGWIHIVEKLLHLNIAVDTATDTGTTALMTAIHNSKKDVVTLLLRHGANPSTQNEHGFTPLFYALFADGNCLELILQAGVKGNETNKEGATALGHAVNLGSVWAVKLFIKYQMDLNVKDRFETTPLMAAAKSVATDGVESALLLLQNGADIHAKDLHGHTALWWAQENKKHALVHYLQEHLKNSEK